MKDGQALGMAKPRDRSGGDGGMSVVKVACRQGYESMGKGLDRLLFSAL
jgi:hypothetical protein